MSSEAHGREERNDGNTLGSVHRNEPIEVLLKYTVTRFAVLFQNSIEARFGGIGLPTAIKEADEVITDLGNLVTVKANNREVIFLVKGDRSVTRLPVGVVSDGGVHCLLDLTHDLRLKDVCEVKSPPLI